MADDRTPRTISLTECPPDDEVRRPRKQDDRSERSRKSRLDRERELANERKASELHLEERPGSRLV